MTKIGIIYAQLLQEEKIFPMIPRSDQSDRPSGAQDVHKNAQTVKVAQNSFQHLDFDRSLLPLFITWCYNHGIKNCPIIGEQVDVIFVTQ